MHSYKDCQEYIKYRKPFRSSTFDHENFYEYEFNSILDLVYGDGIEDFTFVLVIDRKIDEPLDRRIHRTDGPAHIEPGNNLFYYLDGIELNFNEWLKKSTLSKQEKVKLRLKYAT